MSTVECLSCHENRRNEQMISSSKILPQIAERIQAKKVNWSSDEPICELCLNEAIADEAEDRLKVEMKGDLTALERDVIESLRMGETLAQNVSEMDEEIYITTTERIAERIANTVGSFAFAAIVLICVSIWLSFTMRSGLMQEKPAIVFGGLSCALGSLAAIQNPIILMSQRRAGRRDRLRSENDYRVNLKSELEVRYINAKLDYMLEKIDNLHRDDSVIK